MVDYPNVAEGEVLSQLAQMGVDMTQPLSAVLDGDVNCSKEKIDEIKSHLEKNGYFVESVYYDDNKKSALFECGR